MSLRDFVIRLKSKISSTSGRSKLVGKNIVFIAILQAVNIISSFLLVPITIKYISTSHYGIWLTISSIIGWFTLLDIGIGSGLKNKLTESLAKNDYILSKKYVSTTYIAVSAIVIFFLLIFFVSFNFINWATILNQDQSMNDLLTKVMLIVFLFFLLKLILQLISIVLTAHLLTAMSTLLSTLSNLLSLIIIWVLSKTTKGDLYVLATVMSVTSVIMYFIATIILFTSKYKLISPSIKSFDLKLVKPIMGLGIGFFLINISTIVLFQSNNMIIIHFFSNEDVVTYNLAYKLFSIITLLFSIIIQPFWSAFTDAWVKNDFEWIKSSIKVLTLIWKIMFAFGCLLVVFSSFIFKVWVGSDIKVPFLLSMFTFLYFASHTYGGIFNMFINGVGKIRLQIYSLFFIAVIYIPMLILFIQVFHLGLISIPLALLFSNFYSLIIAPMQYKKILSGAATGIWNK